MRHIRRLPHAMGASALAIMPGAAHAQPVNLTTSFDAFGMFTAAEPVVKMVMLILVATSLLSWALCVVKAREMAAGVQAARAATDKLKGAGGLTELETLDTVTSAMVEAARDEIDKSAALIRKARVDGASQRVEDRVARIEASAVLAMRRGLPIFASISSVGPFVGLFGTVWGIMHSFIGISNAKSTSLAVVAPGISEALLATALGLVAAIPATIMYNYLLQRLGAYREALEMGATLVAGLAGREMETTAMAAASTETRFNDTSTRSM